MCRADDFPPYAASFGNQGEGSDWRDGYSPDPCSCTPTACLATCEDRECLGVALDTERSSGYRLRFDPADCPARVPQEVPDAPSR